MTTSLPQVYQTNSHKRHYPLILLNTAVEVNYYRNGGILHTVLRNLVK